MKIDNLIIGDGALACVLADKLKDTHTVIMGPGPVTDRVPLAQTGLSQGVLHRGYRYLLQEDGKMAFALRGAGETWLTLSCATGLWGRAAVRGQCARQMRVIGRRAPAELSQLFGALPTGSVANTGLPLQPGIRVLAVPEAVLDAGHWLAWYRWHHRERITYGALQAVVQRDGRPVSLVVDGREVVPRTIFLAAGASNEPLARRLLEDPPQGEALRQRRPGTQYVLTGDVLPRFYGYVLDREGKLALVVTSRSYPLGPTDWVLGGPLTEPDGNAPEGAWPRILRVLAESFDLPFQRTRRSMQYFVRVEGFCGGARPLDPITQRFHNVVLGWPTKLVWAPRCADEMIKKAEE